MPGELWFDVYGRFLVLLVPGRDGWWRAYLLGPDGRRRTLDDLVIPSEATDVEILHTIEAAYHELAQPGTEIKRVDPPHT